MRHKPSLSRRTFAVAALLIGLTSAFLLPQPTCSDASGCSREPGTSAGSCGGTPCCWGSAGGGCYICYHTVGGGTTMCSESEAGYSYCIDYQW